MSTSNLLHCPIYIVMRPTDEASTRDSVVLTRVVSELEAIKDAPIIGVYLDEAAAFAHADCAIAAAAVYYRALRGVPDFDARVEPISSLRDMIAALEPAPVPLSEFRSCAPAVLAPADLLTPEQIASPCARPGCGHPRGDHGDVGCLVKQGNFEAYVPAFCPCLEFVSVIEVLAGADPAPAVPAPGPIDDDLPF